MATREWTGKTGGGNRGQGMLGLVLRYVDLRVVYCFLPFVVCYYLITAPKRAGAIYSYLRKRQGWSVFRSLIGTYRNHVIFGKCLVDRFYVFAGHKEKFHVSGEHKELFDSYFNTSKALVALSAHFGNCEISSYICGRLNKSLKVIAFGGETEQLQKYRESNMGENNIGMIPIRDDMSHIFEISEQLSNSGAVILTGDRFVSGKRVYSCKFLGAEADFPSGIFYIADKFDCDVVAMFVLRGKKTFEYELVIEPIKIDETIRGRDARAAAYTKAYAAVLEKVVRTHPLQWFNFYDFWRES